MQPLIYGRTSNLRLKPISLFGYTAGTLTADRPTLLPNVGPSQYCYKPMPQAFAYLREEGDNVTTGR